YVEDRGVFGRECCEQHLLPRAVQVLARFGSAGRKNYCFSTRRHCPQPEVRSGPPAARSRNFSIALRFSKIFAATTPECLPSQKDSVQLTGLTESISPKKPSASVGGL